MSVTPDSAPAPLPPGDVRSVIAGLMMVMLLAALDQTIVSTAMPTIGRHLGNIEALPWIVTSYLLSSTVVTPLYGKLADIVGRRRTLMIAIVVFLAGSALCGLAPGMTFLIVARAIQGLGGGGLMSLVQTVISDIVPLRERGKFQGYFAAVFTASSIGGPILGGVIAEKIHWSAIFWINLPVGAVALWIVYNGLRKLPRYERPHKLDLIGAVLMAIAAVSLLLAVHAHGGVLGAPVWAAYAVSIVFWLLFALRLGTAAEPLIPTGLLRNDIVLRATLVSTLAMGVLIGISVYNPMYLQLIFNMTPSQSGYALTPLSLGVVAGSIMSGRLISRGKGEKYKMAPMIGLFLGAVVYGGLAAFPDRLPFWGFVAVLMVANAGIGTMFPVTVSAIQNVVERHQMGTATGMMNFFRSLGGALLVAVFGAVLFSELFGVLGQGAAGGVTPAALDQLRHMPDASLIFRPLFAMAAAGLALSFLILWSMEEKPIRGAEPTVAQSVEAAVPENVLEGADFADETPRR
jgi:EmrB/QacA subfamily drug resistance transporter